MIKRLLVMAVAALALVGAGCGGDDENSEDRGYTATTETRGYAETGQALDDICTSVGAQIDEIASGLTGEAAQDAPILTELVEAQEGAVERVREIEPAPELQETFEQFVELIERRVNDARELQEVAEAGDQAAYEQALDELQQNAESAKPLERALGAEECAKQE